jgi:hypothetical protein
MASERKLRLHALLQLACGAGAQGGQFARGLLVIARHALALFTELVHALTGVLHLFDLRAHFGQERQHLGDGFAIFALQLVEQRQAVLDLLQAAGIRLQARKIVAQATASDGSMRHTSSNRLAARRTCASAASGES